MMNSRSASAARSLLRSASTRSPRQQQTPRNFGAVAATAAAATASTSSASFASSSGASSSSSYAKSIPSVDRAFHCSATRSRPNRKADRAEEVQGSEESAAPTFNARLTPKAAESVDSIQHWLRSAFPGLPFPNDVALQLVTHESWDHGVSAGHSRRLGFMGRRALKFFLSLFLATHGRGQVALTNDRIEELLHTSKLGDHVGRALKLEEVMRWTPAVNDGQQGAKETGLYKIRGVCVEALMGAIYHQHGAQAAKAFFAGRIMPKLGTFTDEERNILSEALSQDARSGEALLLSMAEEVQQSQHSMQSERLALEGDITTSKSTSSAEVVGAGMVTQMQQVDEEAKEAESSHLSSSAPMRRRSKSGPAPAGLPLEEEARPARSLDGMALS